MKSTQRVLCVTDVTALKGADKPVSNKRRSFESKINI